MDDDPEREVVMSETKVIEIQDLYKSYGKVQALNGVNIDVNRGELFGFLGPNGAGKTTTIRCMLDMIRPQSGSIKVLGIDPQKDPKALHKKVGYLPGELNIEANLRVKQALRYFIELRADQVDWEQARQLARRLELDLEMPVKNLSKGNKQKVGLVQALMHNPELLIMDEPTSGLDPLMQQEVYRILRQAKSEGSTVFFSSHIINEVESLADRIAIISDGKIVEEAEPGKLIKMEVRRMQVRFKAVVDASGLAEVPGVTMLSRTNGNQVTLRVEGDLDRVIKALGDYPVADMDLQRQSLEEAFLAYYQKDYQEGS
jgi:ABC-2 type transport system ATP-binding protein